MKHLRFSDKADWLDYGFRFVLSYLYQFGQQSQSQLCKQLRLGSAQVKRAIQDLTPLIASVNVDGTKHYKVKAIRPEYLYPTKYGYAAYFRVRIPLIGAKVNALQNIVLWYAHSNRKTTFTYAYLRRVLNIAKSRMRNTLKQLQKKDALKIERVGNASFTIKTTIPLSWYPVVKKVEDRLPRDIAKRWSNDRLDFVYERLRRAGMTQWRATMVCEWLSRPAFTNRNDDLVVELLSCSELNRKEELAQGYCKGKPYGSYWWSCIVGLVAPRLGVNPEILRKRK